MVVADLFGRQCKPWKAISQNMVELIHEAALCTITKLLTAICDQNTKSRLIKGVIQPSLYTLRQDLQEKLFGFLEPHLSLHPISYDADLASDVQRIQAQRYKRKFDDVARRLCDVTTDGPCRPRSPAVPKPKPELHVLLRALMKETTPDVQEYSASLALDVSEAYYKVRWHRDAKDSLPRPSPHQGENRECGLAGSKGAFVDSFNSILTGCAREICRRPQRQCCRDISRTETPRHVSSLLFFGVIQLCHVHSSRVPTRGYFLSTCKTFLMTD